MAVAASVHEPEPEKLPPLVSELKLTLPVGVVWPVEAVSVTVAVHVVGCSTATVPGEQPTASRSSRSRRAEAALFG